MASVMDLGARLIAQDAPSIHHTGRGLLSRAALDRLNAEVPAQSLLRRATKEGAGHSKQYRMWMLDILTADGVRHDLDLLPEAWAELVDRSCAADFDEWLEDMTGLILRNLPRDVSLYFHGPGDYQSPSNGKPNKVVEFALYLNDHWSTADGGLMEFRSSPDRSGPPTDSIYPEGGNGCTIIPHPESWYGITPVAPDGHRTRMSLTVEYWRR